MKKETHSQNLIWNMKKNVEYAWRPMENLCYPLATIQCVLGAIKTSMNYKTCV